MLWGEERGLEKYQDRIRVHQGVQLVRMMPFLIFGNWAVIGLTLLNAWRAVFDSYAWIPLALEALLVVPVFLSWQRLRNAPPPTSVSRRRIRMAHIHSAVLGACWAAACLLMFPQMTSVQQAMHSGFVSALVLGAAASISYVPLSSLLYAGQLFLSLLLATILHGETDVYVWAAAALGCACIFVQRLNWRNFIEYVRRAEDYSALLSEQLEAQKAVASATQAIMEALPIAVAVTAHDSGKVLFANKEASDLFGPASESVMVDGVYRPFGERPLFADTEALSQLMAYYRARKLFTEWEVQVLDAHGKPLWAQLSGTPILYQGRDCWVTAIVTLEERKRIERELAKAKELAERASNAKTDFLANTSHELRTPLNAIIGYSEILLEEAETDNQAIYAQDLKKIRAAGRHILALINDILDLSKIEAGKMELLPEHVPLDDLLGDIAAVIRNLMTKNGNSFAIENAATVKALWTDVTKVRQIVLNLLSNAGKFTQQGKVTLAVTSFGRDGQDWISFRVSDTGLGIPPEKLAAVFEQYDRGDAGTARRYGGTGLGLALSRKFARLFGGDITVASEPGVGSSFEFTMPAKLAAVEEAEPA